MKIKKITLYKSHGASEYQSDLPLPSFHKSGLYFLRLECSDGLVGYGEPSPYVTGERGLFEAFDSQEIRQFIGKTIHSLEESFLFSAKELSASQRSILSAISQAIYDVLSQKHGVPLWKFCNQNASGTINVYASGGMWYEDTDPTIVLEEAVRSKKLGFFGYKFRPSTPKISGDHFQRSLNPPKVNMPQTMELARTLRSKLGREFPLMIDFGCRLSVDEALWILPRLQEINCTMIEEVVPRVAKDYARIKKSTNILLSGCESMSTIDEFLEWVDCDAIDIVQPDTNMINIFELIKLDSYLESGPVKSILHNWTGGASFFYNAHLAIAMKTCSLLEYSTIHNPLKDLLGYKTIEPLNGVLDLRDTVGSGFSVDESKLIDNCQRVTSIES